MGYCYTPRNHKSANSLIKVPDHLRVVDQHLVNWGIWSRDPKRSQLCGSLEANYKPTDEDLAEYLDEDEIQQFKTKPIAKIKADQRNAVLIQYFVSHLPSVNSRLLLHYWYVHESNIHFIKRKLRLWSDSQLESALNDARKLIKNSLKD